MGFPLLVIGGVAFLALIGDGPFLGTQAVVTYKLYKHETETLPARAMAAVQLQSKDHFSGVCIYG